MELMYCTMMMVCIVAINAVQPQVIVAMYCIGQAMLSHYSTAYVTVVR